MEEGITVFTTVCLWKWSAFSLWWWHVWTSKKLYEMAEASERKEKRRKEKESVTVLSVCACWLAVCGCIAAICSLGNLWKERHIFGIMVLFLAQTVSKHCLCFHVLKSALATCQYFFCLPKILITIRENTGGEVGGVEFQRSQATNLPK